MKLVYGLLFLLLALLAGMGVGIVRMSMLENSNAAQRNGSWWFSKAITSGEDKLVTAQVTAFALFALPPTEAVYLFARKDENNEKLNGSYTYTITGNIHHLKARYWSITAYGKDLFLIPNEAGRYAINGNTVQADSAGNFTIHISHRPQNGNWLPVAKGQRFNLLLRLYQSDEDFIENLSNASLPVVRKTNAL